MPTNSRKKGKPRNTGKKQAVSTRVKKKATPAPARKKSLKALDELRESEDRLKLALEAAQMAIWEWDIKTNKVNWSENVYKLLGLQKNSFDFTLDTYIQLIHPEDQADVLFCIQESLTNKTDFYSEHRLIWTDGSVHWMEGMGKLTVSKRGEPVKMTGTVQNISTQKLVEHEREDWKTRHELISSSAGLVIYDYSIPSGNILWSGNSQDVLGYKPEELGNIDRWVELIHPDDREEAFKQLEIAQEALKPYDVYYRFQMNNGNYCYMHDRGFFIADNQGKAVRMLGMMSDVSERISAEKTIRENNRFRESVESAMPDILYVFDLREQRTVYANKHLGIWLGYTAEDIHTLGQSFARELIHPEDARHLPVWTNEPNGTVKETEYRMRAKNGKWFWFLSRDTPFERDDQDKVIQIVGIAQDITARKEAIDQLNKSEQSYRELFDTVGEAIYIQTPDGIFLDVNKGACLMYGYEKEEFIGRTPGFLSAEGKNDFDQVRELINQAAKGIPQNFEFWGRKKSGEEFLKEVRLTKGSYFGKDIIIATARDITERTKAEEALRESEQRFRTLQQASFGGIGLHDKGVIIDCNQGLCDLSGFTYQELIGMNGLNLIAEEWRPLVREKIMSGYEKPYDAEGVRKDGTRYFLEIHGKNVPYEGRTIRVTEFRDITERKRAEEKIIEQNTKLISVTEDLMRKNDQLEEFTQIVSHNLRSPVGNILTLLNFFETATSDEERNQYFVLLKEASATTLSMLNELNEVLKIKQNKNIEKQDLSFEQIFIQVKSMLNAKITELNAELHYDFEQLPEITYPRIYLESILLNLLSNSLKYHHADRKPVIHLKTYQKNGNFMLEVSDNGVGINLERYGHHMFKLRKTFHKHPESRGIGLFMIKNQIEAMGGEITISSKQNEGSTFFINFNKHQTDGL